MLCVLQVSNKGLSCTALIRLTCCHLAQGTKEVRPLFSRAVVCVCVCTVWLENKLWGGSFLSPGMKLRWSSLTIKTFAGRIIFLTFRECPGNYPCVSYLLTHPAPLFILPSAFSQRPHFKKKNKNIMLAFCKTIGRPFVRCVIIPSSFQDRQS